VTISTATLVPRDMSWRRSRAAVALTHATHTQVSTLQRASRCRARRGTQGTGGRRQ